MTNQFASVTERQIAQLEQEKAHLIASLKDMWVLMQRALEAQKIAEAECRALRGAAPSHGGLTLVQQEAA
jgi:hypothetical protein